MEKYKNYIEKFFNKKTSLVTWIVSFLSIVFLRCFIEQFLALSKPLSSYEYVLEYIHSLYFFSLAVVSIWLFLSFILKINPVKLSKMFVFSLIFIIFPPLIDMIKTGGEVYWSFYLFSSPQDLFLQYITIFGHLPSAIVYFGTKITFLTVIFLLIIAIRLKTKSYLKAIFSAIVIYSILFFMGSFPSFFYYFYNFLFGSKKFLEIKSFEIYNFFGLFEKILGVDFQNFKYTVAYRVDFIYYILLIFLLGILFWQISSRKFMAVLKNFRYPQLVYHNGLFFIGMAIGFINYPENFNFNIFSIFSIANLVIGICLAWKASVVVNDLNDDKIDAISNPERPLQQGIFSREEYAQFGLVCFLLSILSGFNLGFSFAAIFVVYQIIAWFYSAEPLRLKRFPVIASLISSLATLLMLFLGFILISDEQTIHTLSHRIIFLVIIAGTLSLPIKDFKDIAGDKQDNIKTIPVVFGDKKARVIIASGVFISFVLSVFLLNELRLFWWAMLFGSLAFLTVISEKIKPRKIFWPTLGIIFIYGLIMIKVLFF